MKILLLLGDFGMPSLDALLASPHRPACVVIATATAAPMARRPGEVIRARIRPLLWPKTPGPLPSGFRPWAAPEILARVGIPHVNATALDASDVSRLISTHQAELLLSIGYPKILPPMLLAAAPRGGLNVHPSLLPKYRGPSPVFWQVALGEIRTGVTIHRLTAGVDEGPILFQVETGIGTEETAGALFLRLARLAARHIPATLDQLESGSVVERPQDPAAASSHRRFRDEDSLIDWSRHGQDLARLVRACNPFPGARTYLADGEGVRIWRAKALPGPASPRRGMVIAVRRSSFDVATGAGILRVGTATSDRGHRFPAWGRPWPALRLGTMCTSALSVSNPPGATPFYAVEGRQG